MNTCERIVARILVSAVIAMGAAGMNRDAVADTGALRLALLPIPDTLPIHLAVENGYFADMDLSVEILPVGSAVERDQLMQAGRVDGMINEVHGAALFNRDGAKLKIVSTTRSSARSVPMFRILAAPGANIKSTMDLADVPIGVSKNTIIEYVTERVLQQTGVESPAIVTRSVPVLPERLQLLLSGQLKAATLPDPLGYSAVQAGAVEVANDQEIGLNGIVLTFSTEAVNKKTEAVQKFMDGWMRAAAEINADPDKFRDLMLKKIRVPKNVQQTYPIPPLTPGESVSREQWEDAVAWLVEKELLDSEIPYEEGVTDQFLRQ